VIEVAFNQEQVVPAQLNKVCLWAAFKAVETSLKLHNRDVTKKSHEATTCEM
jgi:hypothetical protein